MDAGVVDLSVKKKKEAKLMKKTYLMAGIAILLWSTMATISKVLLGDFDQYQVLCISALFAALALFVVNLLKSNSFPYCLCENSSIVSKTQSLA